MLMPLCDLRDSDPYGFVQVLLFGVVWIPCCTCTPLPHGTAPQYRIGNMEGIVMI